MNEFDRYDQEILDERIILRAKRTDPLIGDWVMFPDGHTERVGYVWPEGMQTSYRGFFQLCESGDGNFSGALNGSIKMEHFTDSGMTRPGRFWFFHHDIWQADNEVDCEVLCRVWHCDCLRD
jgi:hypothetical protein